MAPTLPRFCFWLILTLFRVGSKRRNLAAGKGVLEWNGYVPKLGFKRVNAICGSLLDLRTGYRTETGERWPREIYDRLNTLETAINKIALAEDAPQERIRVQNALIEWQNACEVIERHGFPESTVLAEVQVDLVRARNELGNDQSKGRPR